MYLFKKKYKVDYCGKKFWYTNAKDRYCSGEKVIFILLYVSNRYGLFVLVRGSRADA